MRLLQNSYEQNAISGLFHAWQNVSAKPWESVAA